MEAVLPELIVQRSRRRAPRVGLVLGAGGLLGSAWMTGVLTVLADRLDRPLGEVDLVLGTSAGAVLGAALRCGMGVPELLAHQLGTDPADVDDDRPDALPHLQTIDRESGNGLPPVPLPVFGSLRLLAAAAVAPRRVNPLVAASALLPLGRARMTSLERTVDLLQARGGTTADGWVHEPLWIVAVDYDSGRRIVFGRAGAPAAPVADAVLASCSIPGWIAPYVIDGRRYVDGGVASATSLALLARPEAPPLDEVYVLAPLASHAYDRPHDPVAVVERRVRRLLTHWLDGEVDAVRGAGPRVTVLTPGPADLQAMGGNLMNPRRRTQVLESALATTAAALDEAADEAAGRGAA